MEQIGIRFDDDLFIGDGTGKEVLLRPGTLLTGNGIVLRKSVVGKITIGTVPSTGTAAGGNTGNSTVGSVVGKVNTKVGVYTIKNINLEDSEDTAQYQVTNPSGVVLGIAVPGVAFVSDEIQFLVTAGGTAEIVGDSYTVTVPAGSGKLVLVDSTAIDGSQHAFGVVLDESLDTDTGDKVCSLARTGEFNEDVLIFGGSDDKDDHRAYMESQGMYMGTTQPRVNTYEQ